VKFPVDQLKCTGGVVYSHLFENVNAGIPRDLYWTIEFEFEPLIVEEEPWKVLACIEWLRLPDPRLQNLGSFRAEFDDRDAIREASFYFVEHRTQIDLDCTGGNKIRAALQMEIDLPGHLSFEATPGMQLAANAVLDYAGMIVVPSNLDLGDPSADEVTGIAGRYIDLANHSPPKFDSFRWIFKPI
jgi:hypothetical protein